MTTRLVIPAHYAPIVAGFQSTEETRPYLNGFLAQAHATGVTLVATDGHVLGAFHAPGITVDEAIWRLPKHVLKACNDGPNARSGLTKWLVISGSDQTFTAIVALASSVEDAEHVALSDDSSSMVIDGGLCQKVDGVYPDWRRIISDLGAPQPLAGVAFNSHNLKPFVAVAERDIDGRKNAHASLCLYTTGDREGPMMILTERPDFLGVLVPIRSPGASRGTLPDWLDAARER